MTLVRCCEVGGQDAHLVAARPPQWPHRHQPGGVGARRASLLATAIQEMT